MERIHRIKVPIPYAVGSVNAYYISGPRPALIDTGLQTDDAYHALAQGVEDAGGTLDRVQLIILTHGHLDHAGLAGQIAKRSGATVYAHSADLAPELTGQAPLANGEPRLRAYLADTGAPEEVTERLTHLFLERFTAMMSPLAGFEPLQDGQTFEFNELRLRAVHVPGHSPGCVSLFEERSGILLSGDSLIEEMTFNPVAEMTNSCRPFPLPTLANHLASLKRMEALPVTSVYPGHGRAFANHVERIQRIEQFHRERQARVLKLLGNIENPRQEGSHAAIAPNGHKVHPAGQTAAGEPAERQAENEASLSRIAGTFPRAPEYDGQCSGPLPPGGNCVARAAEASSFQLACKLFPGIEGIEVYHRTVAMTIHLDELCSASRLTSRQVDGVRLYRLNNGLSSCNP